MFKQLSLYIKNQTGYLLFLFFIFVIPLGLFFQFSTYPLPKVQYVFLGLLFLFQYVFYNEKRFRRQIRPKVIRQLEKEIGRTPSSNEIIVRSSFIVSCRGVTILVTAMAIVLLMVYFNEF